MSSVIELQIDQPPTRTATGHGAVVTVRQVADDRGGYPDEPFETAVVAKGQGGTAVTVPAGRYRLEARFPDGRIVRENRIVMKDRRELVRFGSPQSPHEWLVWQTLSGNVPEFQQYGLRRDAMLARDLGNWEQRLKPSIEFLSITSTMNTVSIYGTVDLPIENTADDAIGLWTTRLPDDLAVEEPLDPEGPRRRIAAALSTEEATLFAFLPSPWALTNGDNAEIEILNDPMLPNGRSLRVSVVDGPRSALLSYLGMSRMYEASVTFDAGRYGDQIVLLMQEKRRNPFAAAAAAYAGMVFPAGDPRREKWAPWLENLMNWFPELPDGAILFARDRLDRAETKEDLVLALEALRKAFMRGPPFFSAGVRHLLDGLAFFRTSDVRFALGVEEFEAMYDQVKNLAGYVDATQAFTVLKLRAGFLDVRP